MSMAIFSLVVAITFLPFKMTQASVALGTARIDCAERVRIELARLLSEARAGRGVTLSLPCTLPSGATAWRRIDLTDIDGRAVSYTWQPVDASPATEWRLLRDEQRNGASLPGYPQAVIARGVRDFWMQTTAPGQALPAGIDSRTLLAYIAVYPDDAARPLPDAKKPPVEFGSAVLLANEPATR